MFNQGCLIFLFIRIYVCPRTVTHDHERTWNIDFHPFLHKQSYHALATSTIGQTKALTPAINSLTDTYFDEFTAGQGMADADPSSRRRWSGQVSSRVIL